MCGSEMASESLEKSSVPRANSWKVIWEKESDGSNASSLFPPG